MSIESPAQPAPTFEGSAQPPVPFSPTQSQSSTMSSTTADPQNATSATTASTSASAPEMHTRRPLADEALSPSPSLDSPGALSPRIPPDAQGAPDAAGTTPSEPDQQILEALRSKDRIYVLKLGEMMEGLIIARGVRIELNPTTSYQRLLVYRCSSYYKLSPESDSATKNIYVYFKSESKIPPRKISELVPPEESSQPAIMIMRRHPQDGLRGRHASQAGSVAGEDADMSESETGSVGGRSNTTAASKRIKTLEEREAAYNEARSRIFMDFEEKEKQKEKDMSANSSTFSLTSGSASTSAGREGSVSDLDDCVSTAPTESERSGPVTRERWEGRRSGGSSSRSRNSYNNGSAGSRNSRATSPSYSYPGPYDASHDPSQYMHQPPPPGYIAHYYYPYPSAPSQPHAQPYLAPYQYYNPYYPPHPPLQPHHSDPGTPGDPMYPQHHQQPHPQGPYPNPYMWPPAPPTHSPQMQPQSPPTMSAGGPMPSPPNQPLPQNYPHPHYPYAYPVSYGQPPYQPGQQMGMMGPPPPVQGQPLYMPEYASPPQMAHANSGGPGSEAGSNSHSRASSRSSGHGGNKRGTPSRRNPWSYGPGAGNGGYTYNVPNMGAGMGGNDAVGPRMSSRRISTGSTSSGIRTPGDEASSTASSTSSSSRHTFTSTSTTSHHPLPARPDWAVGLKPQPVLSSRHHDHSGASSRASPRIAAPPPLHPTDFPPLSSAPAPERRTPVSLGGAWTNSSATRSIMSPQAGAPHSALVHYPTQGANGAEGEFERPPPKGNAELFNPKGKKQADKKGDAALAERMGAIALDGPEGGAPVGEGEGVPHLESVAPPSAVVEDVPAS